MPEIPVKFDTKGVEANNFVEAIIHFDRNEAFAQGVIADFNQTHDIKLAEWSSYNEVRATLDAPTLKEFDAVLEKHYKIITTESRVSHGEFPKPDKAAMQVLSTL